MILANECVAQFLSRAVVTGFLFGAAIDVVIGELPKLTGTKAIGSNPLQELWSWLGTLGDSHLVTVLVAMVALTAGQISGTLTSFPVLISISDANLSSNAQANGSDIVPNEIFYLHPEE